VKAISVSPPRTVPASTVSICTLTNPLYFFFYFWTNAKHLLHESVIAVFLIGFALKVGENIYYFDARI